MSLKPSAICPTCRHFVNALPFSWRMGQVLAGILAKKNIKEIAYEMEISFRTAEDYRSKLYQATGTDCIAGLIEWALANGFKFEYQKHDQ